MIIDLKLCKEIQANIKKGTFFLAGCDEVGRGPLAGPVVAACAYLEGTITANTSSKKDQTSLRSAFEKLKAYGVQDSKKMTFQNRVKLLKKLNIENPSAGIPFEVVKSKTFSIKASICEISEGTIDKINILNASLLAMKNSFKMCQKGQRGGTDNSYGIVLFDGNKIPTAMPRGVRAEAIIKGDEKFLLIGLASIIAKVYRDDLMSKMDEQYPGYDFHRHAGYPTKYHKEQIAKLGISPIHRKTFKGVKEFL